MLFIGGLQMLSLGIVGEYIGRIYTEAKQRPLYVVREVLSSAAPEPLARTAAAGSAQ
jgi:dolichol-phosphate mannosyltransferase